ncbi:MAG: glycoside hydrolase family 3 protein [Chloroherpetonaceae bacterium]|nr:glycoside hydrolase family 3 protein [Chloroherpetonaceae bacterium]MCS7211751.1 glycoside hydrolase family 3 protein [Chloroherpetonaceae bacterium]MDW8018772.1 glycoside hydrolase family 3 protein [Chloroherpetonaceae bacterium]
MQRRYQHLAYLALLFAVCFSCQVSAPTVEERITEIMSKMTLDEKIGQMVMVGIQYLESPTDVEKYFLGSVVASAAYYPKPNSNTAKDWADLNDTLQSYALRTRLKIPLLSAIDAVHGNALVYGATVFPHNIGMGAVADVRLIEQVAEATAKEMRAAGFTWNLAPCAAVARDERWGRTVESYSELPEQTAQCVAAAVRGYQGKMLGESGVVACAKHFVGDGATREGINEGDIEIDGKALRAIHFPPYQAAIQAGVGSIMLSYSRFNGEKIHGQKYLIQSVLKEELNFQGIVVSDWGGIYEIASDTVDCIERAISAGIDVVMLPANYKEFITILRTLVRQQRISPKRIDDAVRRVLRVKLSLGLFEQPFAKREWLEKVGSEEHRALARRAVQASTVLLKNEDKLLPLRKDIPRIHVAGKSANSLANQCGGWTVDFSDFTKVPDSIAFGNTFYQALRRTVSANTTISYSPDGTGATGSTVAIVFIGETPYTEVDGDTPNPTLPEEDLIVLRNVAASGVPIIAVLVTGRPLLLGEALAQSKAFLVAWLPGTEAQGLIDIIFGDARPTGKLSHSFPRTLQQVPFNVGESKGEPLFKAGDGLSY